MLYHAKNGTLRAGDISMDYARFGNGPEPLGAMAGSWA